MTNGSLMKVESIAGYSSKSNLQYFWHAFSDNRYWKPILGVSFEWPLKTGFTDSMVSTKWQSVQSCILNLAQSGISDFVPRFPCCIDNLRTAQGMLSVSTAFIPCNSYYAQGIAQWLSGRVLDSRPRGCGFEPHWRQCVVSLSKKNNPSLVLVQT